VRFRARHRPGARIRQTSASPRPFGGYELPEAHVYRFNNLRLTKAVYAERRDVLRQFTQPSLYFSSCAFAPAFDLLKLE